MHSKTCSLFVAATALCIFIAEANAATIANESAYVWKYQGTFLSLNYEYLHPANTGYDSLYLANADYSASVLLFDKNTPLKIVTINETNGLYSISDGLETIQLGNLPEFTFRFSDDGIHFYNTYSLLQADQSGLCYTVSNSATGTTVGLSFYNGQPNVSAVPVPATVFLLGSGLFGLLGVRGGRRLGAKRGGSRALVSNPPDEHATSPMRALS